MNMDQTRLTNLVGDTTRANVHLEVNVTMSIVVPTASNLGIAFCFAESFKQTRNGDVKEEMTGEIPTTVKLSIRLVARRVTKIPLIIVS